MTKKITIKDVANIAGVSITTVSLILNNKAHNIPESTKRHVLSVCEELHFVPNQNACALKSKNSKLIGLILPDLENNYYSRLASILSESFYEIGYCLLTAQTSNDFNTELSLIKSMDARGINGLIFIPSSTPLTKDNNRELEETLNRCSCKCVILDRKVSFSSVNEVINDDKYGAKLATSLLINKGYKKIACITGPNNVSSSNDRLSGYKESLKEHNIKFDKSLIYIGNYRFEKAKELAYKIIMDNKADAIFAFNDISAYAVYDICDKLNKKIGLDIGLIGYDDNVFSSLISPKLSTIRQNLQEICKTAIDILLKDDADFQIVTIKPSLIERRSTR